MEISAPEEKSEPQEIDADLFVTVYGEKEEEVLDSLVSHIGEDETHHYHTWVNVSALRRIGFLFEGGVESAGGIFDILCLVTIIAAVVMVALFWNLVIYVAVILVLGLFSGGAAFKFLKGSFIEAVSEKIPSEKLEAFVVDQVAGGAFVLVKAPDGYEMGDATKQSKTATKVFRAGIYFALLIATIFMIFEVAWYLLYATWMTELWALALFGSGFLVGIAIMDLGVLLRRQLSKRVKY
ncbi:MAG: hypothetical protein ACW98Y_06585 [Candidatus Thorarchaeota archaeon]|jgi:hypothetical protein